MAQDKAYQYMDWPAIEALLYGEMRNPGELLRPRPVREGILYQCFFPGAQSVRLLEKKTGRKHSMVMEDEAGYFALVLAGKKPVPHGFIVDGKELGDPYALPPMPDLGEAGRFKAGISDSSYQALGAHRAVCEGEEGVRFALWAPNALRASVVGSFNNWDGRANPMEYDEASGLFGLFIPGLKEGCAYQYELKTADGRVVSRPDPYGLCFVPGEITSIVSDLKYHWHDKAYLAGRREGGSSEGKPVSILECPRSCFEGCSSELDPDGAVFRKTADELAAYASDMGYTHIELPPVMEYMDERADGFHTTGYYAPTFRLGGPLNLKYLVDRMHAAGIGVILDWTPAQFSPDPAWLASYDGTCLYEHLDPRQGIHPLWGTRIFNYGRPEVRSFLLSNAFYWIREFHADGLRLDGCATMLRLDYGRGNAWVANLWGSNENLEGIDFLKKLTSLIRSEYPEVLLIMEESADVPDTTTAVEEEGLGFDYEWNLHFTEEVREYLAYDPDERTAHQQLMENGMLHNFFKRSILSLSRGIGKFDPRAYFDGIGGDENEKAGAMRAAYGYLFTHPGKKLLAMEEDVLGGDFLKQLLHLYRAEPALYEYDFREEGFEWIRTPTEDNPVMAYMRKGRSPEDSLLVICNFTEEILQSLEIGVPYEGRYREILNSDSEVYGGEGEVNPRPRLTRKGMADEREHVLHLHIGPESVAIFRYQGK